MVKQHSQLMLVIFGALDLVVTAAAAVAAYGVALRGRLLPQGASGGEPLPLLAICLVLTPLLFGRCGLYKTRRTAALFGEWADVFRACLSVWVLTVAIGALMGTMREYLAMLAIFAGLWVIFAIAFRALSRLALRWARRHGWNLRSAAIVGSGRTAQALLGELDRNPWTGIRAMYVVADSAIGETIMGVEVVGPIHKLQEHVSRLPVEVVFVALPAEQHAKMGGILDALTKVATDVRVVPDLLSHALLRRQVSQIGMLPVISLTHTPQEGWNALRKRVFDFVVSLAALAALAPLMLIIAAAIKLTGRGAVFYVQRRTSLGGKPFGMIKFRTMMPDAEAHTGPVMARRNDPRVTSIGRLLRRTSLDELPQLINVLLGQMALVGPRPERPELTNKLRKEVPRYLLRQHVKAGMTGWAQVNGLRGETSMRKRIHHDLYYINNWSFSFDLYVLWLTLIRGFTSSNAY